MNIILIFGVCNIALGLANFAVYPVSRWVGNIILGIGAIILGMLVCSKYVLMGG